jgi:hypothetical protein
VYSAFTAVKDGNYTFSVDLEEPELEGALGVRYLCNQARVGSGGTCYSKVSYSSGTSGAATAWTSESEYFHFHPIAKRYAHDRPYVPT